MPAATRTQCGAIPLLTMNRRRFIAVVLSAVFTTALILACFKVQTSPSSRQVQSADETEGSREHHSVRALLRSEHRATKRDKQTLSLDELEKWFQAQADRQDFDAATIRQLLDQIDYADIPALLALAQRSKNGRALTIALLTVIAEDKPHTAIELAEQLNPGPTRSEAFEKVFLSWMQTAPADARQWAESSMRMELTDAAAASTNPADDRDREVTSLAIIKAWATTEPTAALDWIKSFPESHQRTLMMEDVFRSWVAVDSARASQAALDVADPELRARLSIGVAAEWAKKDSAAAFAWAQALPDSNSRSEVERSVLLTIANTDPAGAMQRAMSLKHDDNITEIVESVVAQWNAHDSASLAAWLKTIPESSFRDASVAVYARNIGSTDPQAGIAWANGISNTAERSEVIETIATSWMQRDPGVAGRTLAQTDLPQDVKERLFQQ